ncbi:MAG: hypothetical protein KU37_05635 [Sulfuricurvum sp. PC08-66]|nr:MAG: hypothetical protein KU37_05635 [Sulfuricurvum sp. PC08-66]
MVLNFKRALFATAMTATIAFAQVGATLHGLKGDQEKAFNAMLDGLEGIGFVVSDPHERINDGYKTKYGTDTLDNLGFFSTTNDAAVRELLEKHPQLGGFSPFNMHIFKYAKEDVTWFGHLDPNTMADIVGLDDKALRSQFVKSFEPLDAYVKETLKPTMEKKIEFTKLPSDKLIEFTVAIEDGVELSDFIDEFQSKYEEAFEAAQYIIAGYKNFKEAYNDMELPFNYDAYWVYSLCHFEFSNGIFKDRADAGIFAPCSIYMYVKPGEKVLHIGMPKLENWIAVNGIKDAKKIKAIRDLDAEVIQVFKSIGAK